MKPPSCDTVCEAISALADSEDPGIDGAALERHLAGCSSCRAFRDAVLGDERGLRAPITVAPAMPDLSSPVTKTAAAADRASSSLLVRGALAVVAAEIVVFALPDLVAGDASGSDAHGSRHLGAFAIAYAVALLVVVVRPARARTILPVAAVLAGALLITAVIDLANGNVPLAGEALHLPELVSVALLWLIANPRRRRDPPGGTTLRAVPNDDASVSARRQ